MTIYAVNGKEPVAAWIPSLDTSGNGTTTLNDLVGSNHGTLTSMDAATGWVADTGSGGVRALDFDGSNDYVRVGDATVLDGATSAAFSAWIKIDNFAVDKAICRKWRAGSQAFIFGLSGAATPFTGLRAAINDGTNAKVWTTPTGVLTASTWHHVMFLWSGGSTGQFYVDGSTATTSTDSTVGTGSPSSIANVAEELSIGGRYNNGTPDSFIDGRIDDLRLFNQSFDSSDVSYLYSGGSGRGITVSTFKPWLVKTKTMMIGCGA